MAEPHHQYKLLPNTPQVNLFTLLEADLEHCRQLNREKNPASVDKALSVFTRANQEGFKGIAAKAALEAAIGYCKVKREYPAAIEYCDIALEYAQKSKAETLYPEIRSLLGISSHYTGNLDRAHENYLLAINLLENTKDRSVKEAEDLAGLYHNLGIIYKEYDDENLCLKYINEALNLYEQINSLKGIALCYNSLAGYYMQKKDNDKALEYNLKSLKLKEDFGDKNSIAISMNNIGVLYSDKGDMERAMDYFNRSLEIQEEIGNKHSIAMSHMFLGETCKRFKAYELGVTHLLQSIDVMKQLGTNLDLENAYKTLAETYECMGDYKNAYEIHKEYAQTREEVLNIEKAKAIIDTKAKFEVEKKDKENEIYRLKNIEIEGYAHQLEISNNELKQFANVASHDLREPLRMISSYMHLLATKLEGRIYDDERVFLNYALEGSKRMDALISDLLSLAKINANVTQVQIDLNEIMTVVNYNLDAQVREKNAMIAINNLPVVMADKTHMVQLFQNLVSNAIKYNKNAQPLVKITANECEGGYEFEVADNGIGISDKDRKRIFEMFQRLHGRDEYNGTGIGLAICKKIVDRLKGRIWIEESDLGGSSFKFFIPNR
jgi:signal transduction histidine kinase/Tfp pilus assembly protein PilF